MTRPLIAVGLLAVAAGPGCAEEATPMDVSRGTPWVTHAGMVAPDVLAVEMQAGRSEYGRPVPYEKRDGDAVEDPKHQRWVKRDGKPVGSLVGAEGKLLHTHDRVVDAGFDARWAGRPDSYRITSPDDPAYAGGAAPTAVYRKSKPTDLARVGPWNFECPTEHVLYLRLPRPLAAGKRYTLTFARSPLAEQSLVWDPARVRSEAVHVSYLGFRPDDPAKVAFLSCWMGSGGPLGYAAGAPFQVLDDATGESVFEGRVALAKAADDLSEDAYQHNFNGVHVYEMDFSALTRPGTYRVSVAGVGCSYPFAIAEDAWRKAFTVSARGFFHQRSGIALGPPHTEFRRPRCFHPDDGVKVYASTAGLMDTGNGLNRKDSNFGELVKGKTDELVPNAWGGYQDAGDWDRRIQHLVVSRVLLDLADLLPGAFDALSLNIPESGGALPDVVDEALFGLDCYRRMQTPEGGIRGGIESSEHPRQGEGSWQESLDIMAYAPDVWSSYEYAGVAARAAGWLETRQPALAKVYRESALRAMRWSEAELPRREGKNDPHAVADSRNLAAAEIFRLTGDAAWNGLFLATTVFQDPKAPLAQWQHHEQREAAWVYARTERPGMDAAVKANCRGALLREADERAAHCSKTGFRWTGDPWRPAGWGMLSAPDGGSLARAHVLTGEAKYLRALVLACQAGGGANPINLCYTTGIGPKSPQHPLHIDSRITNQPAPPGLTVFGPSNPKDHKDEWGMKLIAPYCYPAVEQWPTMEAYFDVFWYPAMCEYTVQGPMAPNAFAWGYLAGRK